MPNLRGKTWTTTTPANVEDAQYWEDHLISNEAAQKAAGAVQSVNNTLPDENGNINITPSPLGPTVVDSLNSTSATDALSANMGHALKGLVDAKQNTLTFDNVPTNGSDNPVKSDGIYDALAPKVSESLLKSTVGWVGKNKLEVTATSHTDEGSGTVYTVNTDKSISCANTPSANTSCFVGELDASVLVVGKKYILSGCPANGSDEKWYLRIGKKANASDTWGTMVVKDFGEGAEFTVPSNDYGFVVHIGIMANQSTGFMFYPMLRDASITDSTFEPYHESVEQTLRDAEVIEGKNKLPITLDILKANNTSGTWSGNVYTYNSVTYTVETDSDGRVVGIKVNGTTNALTYFILDKSFNTVKYEGYLINGFVEGSASSFRVSSQNDFVSLQEIIANDTQIQNNGSNCRLSLRLDNGASISNKVFYPMLRDASETDPTFEPFYIPLKDSKMSWEANAKTGVHNFLPIQIDKMKPLNTQGTWSNNVYTANGMTFTFTEENGYARKVNLNGQANAGIDVKLGDYTLRKGTYRIKCGLYTNNFNTRFAITTASGTYVEFAYDKDGNDVFTLSEDTVVRPRLYLSNGDSRTNVNLYPEITLAEDTYEDYTPYAMTNRELTEAVTPITSEVTTTFTVSENVNSIIKIGKLVQIDLKLSGVTAASGDSLFTVPAGFRPKINSMVYLSRYSGGLLPITIFTNGDTQILTALSNTNCQIHIMYFTD